MRFEPIMTFNAGPAAGSKILDIGFLSAIVGALPQPVLVVSPESRVLVANRAACDILPALRVGEPLVRALRDPTVLDALRRVDGPDSSEVVTWRDRFPVERVFDVTISALVQGDGPRATILTLHDLTEARRIERMRADFIANASHELRTPLASLLGFVETLQGSARDDPRARDRFLAIMAEQARRMARLIDDLLSLSRIEQKRHIKPSAAVDLARVVGHVADTLSTLAQSNGMRFVLDLADGIEVAGDRDEIVRIVENLIENAIKYGRRTTASGGEGADEQAISITVTAAREMGVLAVSDGGDGIAPEHLPRLTERFYRIDAGQSRAKGGTGLGLALVKHIVAHHRGRLDIDSTVGHGSTFRVSIPLLPKVPELSWP